MAMVSFRDEKQKQTGAKAMIVKLALQMTVADAEFGLFFVGYIVIAAQLVKSADPSHSGLTLLLSPTFKLHNQPLPIPNMEKRLTPFHNDILPEPFLAILVAMLCANLLPGRSVTMPPAAFLEPIPDVEADEEDDDESDRNNDKDTSEDRDEQSGIPAYSLQIRTNAMTLRHPWLNCSDIHRIALVGHSARPPSNVQRVKGSIPSKKSLSTSPPHLRNLLRAPRIPSTNIDTVTLVERIRVGRWSSIYTCRVESEDKLCIMKLVEERHSEMVLRELYMYDAVLKGCSLVPQFYGAFQRPAGGWFGFLLENVGDSLEDVYGSEWGNVKADLSVADWKSLVDSVKKLHSLGIMHGDLEPRNVARTREGTFKFFDFGRSEMHRCRKGGCEEVRELLDV
ncbi:kinase-like domain-containing protein [Armillaria mellea]|nr:kinase-like domain-containing protein [Armillaria mellea]